MKQPPTKEYVLQHLNYADGKLYWKHVNRGEAGCINTQGYIVIRLNKVLYLAHRLVWLVENGYMPDERIDHIDEDRANNKIDNLRVATMSQNLCNRSKPKSNTSGYKGVGFSKYAKKWVAAIGINNKSKHLGYFSSPEEASIAYQKAASIYHGKFAKS
jgi:hypothetical protein